MFTDLLKIKKEEAINILKKVPTEELLQVLFNDFGLEIISMLQKILPHSHDKTVYEKDF